MENFEMRAHNALVRYLKRRGYDIVVEDYVTDYGTFGAVAFDEDELVFVEFVLSPGEVGDGKLFASGNLTREQRELMAFSYLTENPGDLEMSVRFDVVSLAAVNPDKAIVRHQISVQDGE